MNLTALQTRCANRYRDTGNAIIAAADWTEYLNDAYADVLTADPLWPFLQGRTTGLSIAPGGNTVALPSDVWRVTAVYNATDHFALVPVPGDAEYRHWFPDPSANRGTPQWYRLRGSTLEVYPYPAVTTSLDVDTIGPPAALLAAGGDEPVFPEQFHRILVEGALARAYTDDENSEAAAAAQGRFDRLLQSMKIELLSPRTEGYPQVIDTF